MAYFNINNFKGGIINPISLINQTVSVENNGSENNFIDILSELDSLREAIFFKLEKIKTKENSEADDVILSEFNNWKREIKNISLPSLGPASDLFEKQKKLNELLKIQKILNCCINIKDNTDDNLEILLRSDKIEDLETLAFIIDLHLKYAGQSNLDIFLKYSKKLEEKMISKFKDTMRNEDNILGSKIFNVLAIIGKEYAMIDQFLLSNELLTYKTTIHPPAEPSINLDNLYFEENSFSFFINDIQSIIENKKSQMFKLFGNEIEYREYIFSRIYKTLIGMALEKLLNVSNSAIFLFSFYGAYLKLQSFSHNLILSFPKFDYNIYINEILNQFRYKAINKESQLFDEILSIFLSDAKSINSFFLLGERVMKNEDFSKVYERMLILIDSFFIRSKVFYSDEDEKEILKYFSKRLISIIDKIIVSKKPKIELVSKLRYIFSLNHRFFGEKIMIVDSLNTKISDFIIKTVNEQTENDKSVLSAEISSMPLINSEESKKIINYLQKSFKMADVFDKINKLGLIEDILDYMFVQFCSKLQSEDLSSKKIDVLHDCLNGIVGFISLNYENSIKNSLKKLIMICSMLKLTKEKFLESYKHASCVLNENDLQLLIKYRKDSEEIRKMINRY